MRMRWRAAAGAAVAAGVLALASAPAGAVFTQNGIQCAGEATITDPDGNTYPGRATDVAVEVPREGVADWSGSIGTVTHDHFGEINLAVGPVPVQLGKWGPSENDDDESSAQGTKEIPDLLQFVLPGEYVLSGFHQGDEGRCAGSVVAAVDVSPFSTPTGIGAMVLTVLSGLGLWGSAMAKATKP